ncbi:L-prolyl-[peptidyl-carrier protein] dehydrogenase [Paraburkholderia hiiakae]|uniref:L-prolyl-[peptidyl-carrier protein] dehydrogenase n=1 Tax=Paraburkholderia hiiakae TaxID=1081782 RepID=A0ABM8N7V5_9BURK|nr:acyl-CoA dehydrogenase [Paraburkholderia hiiakae]CAD6506710.1 L-prolyl-[peptidyl-carrier protein] dehydrogenase [Paraburkholderia hiiakae]
MNFNFTEEQQQLADALRRYLDKNYGFEARQAIVKTPAGVSGQHWNAFVELGLTALPVPTEQGGFDGTPFDMLVVMQELGRALVIEPYCATAVGVEALKLAGGAANADNAALLERVASGEIKLAAAFHEPQSRYDLFSLETQAKETGDGFALTGTKSVVQHGAQADYWIVPARFAGEVALFAVARDAKGVEVNEYRTIDGQRAATLSFKEAHARRLGDAHSGAATWEKIADYATFLLCSEAVGAMDALNHATVEYTKTRQQFGVPIARFQALQHRMAEMLIHAEQARSLTYLAAARYSSESADERRRAISAAKVRVGQAARFIGQQAVQLHGGMGVTDEVAAAHLFKRLAIIETTLGDVDHHLERFASLPGFAQAA